MLQCMLSGLVPEPQLAVVPLRLAIGPLRFVRYHRRPCDGLVSLFSAAMAAPLSLATLHAALANSSADASAGALNELRSALRLHAADLGEYATAHLAIGDPRLALAREVCEGEPPLLPLVFDAWDVAEERTLPTLRPVPMQVLSQLLDLLSAHQPYHAPGEALMAQLLAPSAPWMARLHTYLQNATQRKDKRDAQGGTVAALVALKLLTSMANFARGKLAASVWERFHWTSDMHARLLSMRRRARATSSVTLHDTDIRTQYMLFLGAMLTQPFHATLKTALLDLGADMLPVLFRGLHGDPARVVQYTLLVFHEELFKDTAVPRGAKARMMNDSACASLLRLYTREEVVEGVQTSVADMVHHFFLSIATHPGFGICYADRGWYSKTDEEGGPHLYNKVLAHLVRQLAVIDDLRQQELALRILRACPELVAGYLSHGQKTLAMEPRAESAWLGTMAFVGRVLALPLPLAVVPTPPPHATILANTAPDLLLRAFQRGLRHTDALVQYFSCLVIARALQRIEQVQRVAREAAARADETHDGAWTSALRALELAWRKRFPPVDTVAQLVSETGSMRQEVALRVVALYHTALPSMTFDTRYDAAKLLSSAFLDTHARGPLHLERLCRLHALRIVARTTEAAYDVCAKAPAAWPGLALRSNLHFLLALYTQTEGGVHTAAATLLHAQLKRTALFAHDPSELDAWLHALPSTWDAVPSVLNFWDECWQRCLKTPYRYAERMRELIRMHSDVPEKQYFSPLLVVLVEQASVRIEKGLFDTEQGAAANASEPIVAYVSRLLLQLAARRKPWIPLYGLSNRLAEHASHAHGETAALLAHSTELWQAFREPVRARTLGRAAAATTLSPDKLWTLSPVTDNLWKLHPAWLDDPAAAPLAVLHSHWINYPRLVGLAGREAWRMFWSVLLQRLHPKSSVSIELIRATFQAIGTWCTSYQLSPSDLELYLLRDSVTFLWLEQNPEVPCMSAFRTGVVQTACTIANHDAAYKPVLARLVDNVAMHLERNARTPTVLANVQALAWSASETARAAMVRTLLAALATPSECQSAQLAALTALAGTGALRAQGHDTPAVHALQQSLATLVPLYDRPGGVRLLHRVLASALPAGLDGAHPASYGSLRTWKVLRAQPIPVAMLAQGTPTPALDAVLMRLVYALPDGHRALVAGWGSKDAAASFPLATVAILERTVAANEHVPPFLADIVLTHMDRCVGHTEAVPRCLAGALLYQASDAYRPALVARLEQALQSAPVVTPALVWLVDAWKEHSGLVATYTTRALEGLVRQYVEEHDTESTRQAVRAFTALLLRVRTVEGDVETVLEAILSHRMDDVDAIRLASVLVRLHTVRPTKAARLVNTVLANTELVSQIRAPAAETPLRDAMVSLLVTLTRQAPDALTTPTTVARFVYLYKGTLSRSDRRLFALLQFHEQRSGQSLLDTLRGWGTEPPIVPLSLERETLLHALLSLDPQRAHTTAVQFPRAVKRAPDASDAYDPWLVLNLVGGAILEREALGEEAFLTGLEWLAVLRTGAVGIVVCACSSHRSALRAFALGLLGKVTAAIRRTTFRERDLVVLMLDRIRDTIPPPPPTSVTGRYDEIPWLPTMATLFIAHCLRAVAAPQMTLFPTFCRFLLQRPKLDVTDVPLLYNLLHSSSDQLHHERSWLLRFLDDALVAHARLANGARAPEARRRTRADWRVFQRRHVWDLLVSLYDALADGALAGIHANTHAEARDQARLESLFLHAAEIPYLASTLVARRGFLDWIAMRMVRGRAGKAGPYWLRLTSAVCGVETERASRLAHLAGLDRVLEQALVLRVLTMVSDELGLGRATVPTYEAMVVACDLVHALLEYTAMRDTPSPYVVEEAKVAVALLRHLSPRVLPEAPPKLAARLLSATLYLGLEPDTTKVQSGALLPLYADQLQFGRQSRAYAPRHWALALVGDGPCE